MAKEFNLFVRYSILRESRLLIFRDLMDVLFFSSIFNALGTAFLKASFRYSDQSKISIGFLLYLNNLLCLFSKSLFFWWLSLIVDKINLKLVKNENLGRVDRKILILNPLAIQDFKSKKIRGEYFPVGINRSKNSLEFFNAPDYTMVYYRKYRRRFSKEWEITKSFLLGKGYFLGGILILLI